VTVALELSGRGATGAGAALGVIDGVLQVEQYLDDEE
jgi:hypothetical protein